MPEPDSQDGESVSANGQQPQHADGDLDHALDPEPAPLSWFEPAARADGQQVSAADGAGVRAQSNGWAGRDAGNGSHQAEEWFLRTGRAGLLPESMSESWEEAGDSPGKPVTAAEPPWAGEYAAITRDAPPPWESGPWPGPGEPPPEPATELAAPADRLRGAQEQAGPSNWQATAALATGILPVVVPGVVLGILGLRRAAATGTGRMWSWLGIALSVIWAIILTAYLLGGGQSVQACGSYQSDVNYPVSQVLRDLASGAPESVLAQDLHVAISQANSAAAAAQQVSARDAMVALTSGMQQALSAVSTKHPAASYALIHRQLAADAAAVDRACAS